MYLNRQQTKEKIDFALEALDNAVGSTIGPNGYNGLVFDQVVNDGITIAENLFTEDMAADVVIRHIVQGCRNTDATSGDGTTSTILLTKAIYNELKDKNYGTFRIKKELNELKDYLKGLINERTYKTEKTMLKNIAFVSLGGDQELADKLVEAFDKTNNVKVVLSNKSDVIFEHTTGYVMETRLLSRHYLGANESIVFNDATISYDPFNDGKYDELESLLDEHIKMNKALVIIRPNFDNKITAMTQVIIEKGLPIVFAKSPYYGDRSIDIYKDYSSLLFDKGSATIEITNDKMTIMNVKPDTYYIEQLSKSIKECEVDYEIEKRKERLENLSCNIVIVKCGAITDSARTELYHRIKDAISSIKSAQNGVVKGAGLSILNYGSPLEQTANIIFKRLTGIEERFDVEENQYYDGISNTFITVEDINEIKVLDSADMMKNIVDSAITVATTLLTLSSISIPPQPGM